MLSHECTCYERHPEPGCPLAAMQRHHAYLAENPYHGPWQCGRCKRAIPGVDYEYCWYCDGMLCVECWDAKGHCGHPEADAINQASRTMTPDQRHNMIKSLHSDMVMLTSEPPEEEPN